MLQEAAPAPPAACKGSASAFDTQGQRQPAEFEIPIAIDAPSPGTTSMEDLSAELAAATPPSSAEQQDEPIAISFDEPPATNRSQAKSSKSPAPPPPRPPAPPEPEFELEQDYELVITPEPLVPAFEQKPPEPLAQAPPSASLSADQFLADMVSEIDELGIDQLAPVSSKPRPTAPVAPPPPPVKAPPPASAARPSQTTPKPDRLKEVFDEFRAELGEMGGEDEDLENALTTSASPSAKWVLLEEAISEFQKVAKATDKGKAFQYAMQCCTLLGLAFMEKGQPSIAAIWYERALHTPGVDAESILAFAV